jgi:phage regulator Rha-like protein
MDKIKSLMLTSEAIERKIYLIRGEKVMLDNELATLYNVKTKVLLQAVKRNIKRFPDDFMFQLDNKEFVILRSQIVTSNWGGRRYPPYAFTEQGIAMLSSVLKSERAIQVNIQIMRTFTRIKEMLTTHKELREKIEQMERKYDQRFKVVFEYIRALLSVPKKEIKQIGFEK